MFAVHHVCCQPCHLLDAFRMATKVAIPTQAELLPVTRRGLCNHWVAAVLRGYVLPQDIPSIIKTCRAPGPLYLSSLSDEELQLLDNMMNRLYKIAEVAAKVTVASRSIHSCVG